MYIVMLRFSENKAKAGEFMEGHKAWVARGFADGVFLLVGSLQPKQGGAVVAHGVSRAELEQRVSEDPFVVENIVSVEIIEIEPSRVDERLRFIAA